MMRHWTSALVFAAPMLLAAPAEAQRTDALQRQGGIAPNKPAAAEGPVADLPYGAIAISLTDRIYRYSGAFATQGEAEAEALNKCGAAGGTDCVVTNWFSNACGAMALGDAGWGASWGETSPEAERKAVELCRGETVGCQVAESVCVGE